jgi:hypothetical protein
MSPPRRKERQGRLKSCTSGRWTHTFSAFWLRSSVVSVLTSLISGTGTTGPYQDYPNLLNHRAGSRGLPRPVRKWPRHCTARQVSLVPSGINLQSNECTLSGCVYIFLCSLFLWGWFWFFLLVFPRVSDNWLVAPHTVLCNDSSLLNLVLAFLKAHTYLASVRDLVPWIRDHWGGAPIGERVLARWRCEPVLLLLRG